MQPQPSWGPQGQSKYFKRYLADRGTGGDNTSFPDKTWPSSFGKFGNVIVN